jgi:hypothetical protein
VDSDVSEEHAVYSQDSTLKVACFFETSVSQDYTVLQSRWPQSKDHIKFSQNLYFVAFIYISLKGYFE